MGQISLPVLNRTGYSMFWQSNWEDVHNYSRSLREDFFLKKIFPQIFLEKFSKKKHFINLKTIKNYVKSNKNLFWFDFDFKQKYVKKYLKWYNNKKLSVKYPFKLWIVRFQTWILLSFSIYTPLFFRRKIRKKTKTRSSVIKYNFFFINSFFINKIFSKKTIYEKYNF